MNHDAKQKTQDSLNRRNTESIHAKIIEQDLMIREQQKSLDAMGRSLSAMSERMNALEQMVQLQKVKMVGSGPSVV